MVEPDISRDGLSQDQDAAFKKPYQVVGRPPVTDHDVHEEYVNDPPHNVPTEPTTERKARGLKEGAWEEDPKQTGVLGEHEEVTGRIPKETALAILQELEQGSPEDA